MRYTTILLAIILCAGCSAIPMDYTPSPDGDEVDITLQNRECLTGEFVAMDDSSVFVILSEPCDAFIPPISEGELVCVRLRTLRSVSVNGYNDRSWLVPVAVLQVLPAVLMGIAAERYNESGGLYFGISIVPALVTAALFEASTPRAPKATWPFPLNELENIRKYARYPAGMPAGAIEPLLARQNQRSIRYIP